MIAEEQGNIGSAIEANDLATVNTVLELLITKVSALQSSIGTQGGNFNDLSTASQFTDRLLSQLRAMQATARG
jgi:hypothetical protein